MECTIHPNTPFSKVSQHTHIQEKIFYILCDSIDLVDKETQEIVKDEMLDILDKLVEPFPIFEVEDYYYEYSE